MPDKPKPPQSPFELRIAINGETWDYCVRIAKEVAHHIAEHGLNCSLTSGGGGGSHSVDIQVRDISVEDFRKELQAWFEKTRFDA